MSDKLCVIMPVYNEQEAIGAVLEKWDATLKSLGIDYEIRPYNDGSLDKSLEVMQQIAQKRVHVNVRDKPNGGHGNTILTGYREAAADGFDWIFQIDSDDEMGPEKFNELWSRRNDYDFLTGMRDGRRQALPRKIISFVSRLCVRLFYGKSVWDVNTPYRLMRVTAFKDFFSRIPMSTFAPNVILSGLAARHKLRCFEARIPQHDRMTGEVSIKKWKLMKAAIKSFWQTIGFSFGGDMPSKHECGDFLQQILTDVKSSPKWMLIGLGVVIFAVYGITFTFPSMVYDFAAAKGDRLQVFLTYFFMHRYTEGAIASLFYDFSPIWSNVVEVVFLYAAMVLLGVLGKRLKARNYSIFLGLVLWAVSPVVYDRVVGQHCVPSHGIALFVDAIALLLFYDIRNYKRFSWNKFLLLEGCIIFSTGEYQAHINLLLTAFCGLCMISPCNTLRGWFDDIKLIGATLGLGIVGWFLLSYGPVLVLKSIGFSIPQSGGAHDHVFWLDGQRSFFTNLKSLVAGLIIDFGYNSFFVLGIRLAVIAWCVWMVKVGSALFKRKPVVAIYMFTFAMSPLLHPIVQCSTAVMRAQFWFMPFVGFSYMICCNWALSHKTFFRRIVILFVSLFTLESCHETATLYYFRWKVLEQDRLHASIVASDLWKLYGTKLPKPVFTIGYLGRYPTNWDDLRECRFLPLIHHPFSRLFSNMFGYGYNCPREVFMYLRELVGLVCTMPEASVCKSLSERVGLITSKPAYPEPGYIFEEDGVIVVNFGDPSSRWDSFDYANWRSPNEDLLFRTLKLDAISEFLRKHIYVPARKLSEDITNY